MNACAIVYWWEWEMLSLFEIGVEGWACVFLPVEHMGWLLMERQRVIRENY